MNSVAIGLFFSHVAFVFSMHLIIFYLLGKNVMLTSLLMTLVTLTSMISFGITLGINNINKIVNEWFTNVSPAEYIPLDTSDDLLIEDKDEQPPNSIITYQQSSNELLLDDDDIKTIAKENVEKRIKQQSLQIRKEDEDKPQTNKYGVDRFTEILLTADVLRQTWEDLDTDETLIAEMSEKETEMKSQEATDEDIKKALDDIKKQYFQEKIDILKDEKIAKLEAEEEESLLYERYYLAQKIISEKLEQDEFKNPYNILPLDLWYKPDKTAKDVLAKKPCMCPAEVKINDKINYSDLYSINERSA